MAEALIKRKHKVLGFDVGKKAKIKGLYKYYSGNVLDQKKTERAIKEAEAVVHLAALTSHKDIVGNKFKTLKINFLGTQNILSFFLKSKKSKKLIYSSTGKVYGDIKFLPITENHPLLPLNVLGKSKVITEKLIDFYSNSEKSFIVFRIFNVFGPGQKQSFLIPTIKEQLKKSGNIVLGDIKAKRDYIFIDDVVLAFVLAIEKKSDSGFSVFNVCSEKSYSAKEIAVLAAKILNKKLKIKVKKNLIRKDEKSVEFGSSKKINKTFGWKPKHDLKKGLEKTIK